MEHVPCGPVLFACCISVQELLGERREERDCYGCCATLKAHSALIPFH